MCFFVCLYFVFSLVNNMLTEEDIPNIPELFSTTMSVIYL